MLKFPPPKERYLMMTDKSFMQLETEFQTKEIYDVILSYLILFWNKSVSVFHSSLI